jgi:hypothetical protein
VLILGDLGDFFNLSIELERSLDFERSLDLSLSFEFSFGERVSSVPRPMGLPWSFVSILTVFGNGEPS